MNGTNDDTHEESAPDTTVPESGTLPVPASSRAGIAWLVAVVLLVGLGGAAFWFTSARGTAPITRIAPVKTPAPAGTAVAPVRPARSFYVATNGQGKAAGTAEAPLDLATALSANGPAQPGDTIWVRGGTYKGAFRSQLKGTPEAPIIVRVIPGERAVIDTTDSKGDGLFVNGGWTWYWGFEILNSEPKRESTKEFALDITRGTGVTSHAPGAKFINLIVHDMKIGMGIWASSPDSEVYGSLVYHNGYKASDRGHGHGIYSQNETGSQRFIDNILFGGFSHGIHVYGSDAAHLNNIRLEGNAVFNSGVLDDYFQRNILLGGGRRAENPVLVENYTYYSQSKRGGENNVGYSAGCSNLQARRNYWAHLGRYPLILENCEGVLEDNVMLGFVNDPFMVRHPKNTYIREKPAGAKVILRPNRYEPGRANVIVYNWDQRPSVDLDLTTSGLTPGKRYVIRDAQNYFGDPVAAGTYNPGQLTPLTMSAHVAAPPAGNVPEVPSHTGREFGVFIVEPQPERRP